MVEKKLIKKAGLVLTGVLCLGLFSCKDTPAKITNEDGTVSILKVDPDEKAISYNKKYDGFNNVTIVNLSKSTKRNPVTIDLSEYANKDVMLEFKMDILIDDKTDKKNQLTIILNDVANDLPKLFDDKVENGKWISVKSTMYTHLDEKRQIFLSGAGWDTNNVTFYIKDFELKITGENLGAASISENWMEAKALKDAYKGIFDYVGFAVGYNNELDRKNVQAGLKYQVDAITMGNEFKPDFIFNWHQPATFVDFKGEDGKFYKVPAQNPDFVRVDKILQICKENGLKMRGHVLVWHSQTPDWFFRKNWGLNGAKDYVSMSEMTARQEWYIKTVLEHVAAWERDNNDGKHIIFTWDVVNEAASDGATDTAWLRTDSNWYKVYNSDKFIVNAFRFANKYAPKDVKLAYNDYGEYSPQKVKAICKIIDAIQAAPDARIDILGMQAHVQIKYPPVYGEGSFEQAIQTYAAKGLNIQVTELDVANDKAMYNPFEMKARYNDLYKMFVKNRKTADKNGVEGVTIWGLNDETTWLNAMQNYAGHTQYPLLFRTGEYMCKPCFYGVLEAAE